VAALFCFILSFSYFLSPYYLGGSKPPTPSIMIVDSTKSGQQWPRAAVIWWWRTMWEVVIPFTKPSIIAALCLTAAVSFDEFAVAWFVSGLNKTIPVVILEILQGNVDPQINAIGTFVFVISMTLVVIAQSLIMSKGKQGDATP
jgi:ABC-type Fe3+ transport system permease subunit